MGNKKFILTADDFGVNNSINRGVLDGYNAGLITSASLCANGKEFDAAVNEILPECPHLSINAHLNISDGKALSDCEFIVDNKKKFNNTYLALCSMSANPKGILNIEKEFRKQIEKILELTPVYAITSRRNVHSIPQIFKLTCKLAAEYNIPYIRLPREEILLSTQIGKYSKTKFSVNLIKTLLMNLFSRKNTITSGRFGTETNNFTIGSLYREFLNSQLIEEYLTGIDENCIIECFLTPDKQKHPNDYALAQDKLLADKIFRAGFDLTNYKNLK